jgi:hypothetical protein
LNTRTILAVAITLVLGACGAVGSGDIITEQREVDTFDRVEVRGGMAVDLLVEPDATQEVTVTFDDNLLDRVVTRVRGNTLIVEFDGGAQFTGAGRFVAVIMPSLEAVIASGGADVIGSGAENTIQVQASGGSSVDLTDMAARTVELEASGGSDVVVFASQTVTGETSGGSDVTVFGNPSEVSINSTGGSDVSLAD